MAVYYKVYQDNRTNNPHKGQWYGRASHVGVIDDDTLSQRIEEKCTVHKADVKAVLTALVGEITNALQNSYRVRLAGLGSFKIGLSSKPSESRDKFTTANIHGAHVIFMPETKVDGSTGARTRAMLTGVRFKELSFYSDGKGDGDGNGKSGGGSSGTGGEPDA